MELNLKLTGIAPLIMHSDKTADPLHPETKALKKVTSKKKKTDEDHAEVARLEWIAGLYRDDDGKVILPADNVVKCLIEGLRRNKLGKVGSGAVFPLAPWFTLDHDGPDDIEKLYTAKGGRFVYRRTVGNQKARVMRCRPIFREWTSIISFEVDTEELDTQTVVDAMTAAGRYVGIGDRRPRFGRFEVQRI